MPDFPWESLRHRLILTNPNYNRDGLKVRNWGLECAITRNTPMGTLAPLIADLARRPVIEPAQVYALPEGNFIQFGVTRLQALRAVSALYHIRRPLPVVVSDYTGAYANCEPLNTRDDILSKFTSPPMQFYMGSKFLVIHNTRDHHRENELNLAHPSWDDMPVVWARDNYDWDKHWC